MFENEMAEQLEKADVDMVISLPCDKNKGFTDLVHERFPVVDITREEDGVGICAGAYLMGKRPVISIQSSGIGNMMNAIMSLTACYRLPMVILASWRGVDGERIEAQIPFNSRIPGLLDCYGIGCTDLADPGDIPKVSGTIDRAFSEGSIEVVLIHPKLWGESKRTITEYPPRRRHVKVAIDDEFEPPTMTRLDAIERIMAAVGEDDIVVSNIGVPSKEVHAARDRPLNFYMLGSYTQATPIGLGMALSTDRRVFVIDGDGSLLGSSIFPVLSAMDPNNLTVICLDNGTFGSTGNQINQAYLDVDLGAVAVAYGIDNVYSTGDPEALDGILREVEGMSFVHVLIVPKNSDSPNLTLTAAEIRDRFMGAL